MGGSHSPTSYEPTSPGPRSTRTLPSKPATWWSSPAPRGPDSPPATSSPSNRQRAAVAPDRPTRIPSGTPAPNEPHQGRRWFADDHRDRTPLERTHGQPLHQSDMQKPGPARARVAGSRVRALEPYL